MAKYHSKKHIFDSRNTIIADSIYLISPYEKFRILSRETLKYPSIFIGLQGTRGGNTKAVILCGGPGIRLREQTELIPKPAVQIGNKPMLWQIKNICYHKGFNEFALRPGYRGENIKDHFAHYLQKCHDFTPEIENDNRIQDNDMEWKIWKD
jgi:hypothetical protein